MATIVAQPADTGTSEALASPVEARAAGVGSSRRPRPVEQLLPRDFVEIGASGRRWSRQEMISSCSSHRAWRRRHLRPRCPPRRSRRHARDPPRAPRIFSDSPRLRTGAHLATTGRCDSTRRRPSDLPNGPGRRTTRTSRERRVDAGWLVSHGGACLLAGAVSSARMSTEPRARTTSLHRTWAIRNGMSGLGGAVQRPVTSGVSPGAGALRSRTDRAGVIETPASAFELADQGDSHGEQQKASDHCTAQPGPTLGLCVSSGSPTQCSSRTAGTYAR
jgi:hypothetical protein